ncbi:three-Cys-motif partner protein TcmP [Breznakiella homolactica]|uniref:Three-Cys-motif partner protein TcmP n=1 Tax=Breznakiella homolactica TaxID=2798577 RepID=A0A7T7XKI3_9SPIR|nr:three-Cys-motif partner protein TcmP [Breznakiella homolactica]QQO07873.1 three-Cys-motif partner protein TcmP [Breznakiella homolactica]
MRNDNFFVVKKPWSEVKDELLGCYFKPYVSKILHTYRPLVYVDCFAGKGKFEDGNPGSPLIALDILQECTSSTTMEKTEIKTYFIDLNYAEDLRQNLATYPNVEIISGCYETEIINILAGENKSNVFLYIDPYGIKALHCSLFDYFAQYGFNTIELLINFNSFGFIREACRVFGLAYDVTNVFDDLVEYESTQLDTSQNSLLELNEIAGGNYWQEIINDYKRKVINGYEAEALFVEAYCKRLRQSYRYVLNLPLRIKKGQRPKYRMIHATNHRDGCLLMVDNICNRWQALQGIQNRGQLTLWEESPDNLSIDESDISQKILAHIPNYREWTSLHDVLSDFFVEYGAICSTTAAKAVVANLVSLNRIELERDPPFTETGRAATYMTEGRNKKVSIKWVP